MVNRRKRVFVFGFGFSAAATARRLAPEFTIQATCRTEEKRAVLAAQGIEACLFGEKLDDALCSATHILLSVPPDEEGDPAFRLYASEIARNASHLEWLGYLSTTGVYGDHGGEWVDEETPLSPSSARGARRVAAEEAWQMLALSYGLPLHIFRLAGIYGPGRNQLESLREGKARRIIKPGQVFSRIHVDDVAQALAASMRHPAPGSVYNLCDDEPAPPQDVIAFAADLLGVPVPPEVPYEQADLSPMAKSFYAESKRVSNQLMHERLGIKLIYPSYREGLRALLEQEPPR